MFEYQLKILIGEKRTPALIKKYEYGNLGCWDIKSTLSNRFLNWNKIFKKMKLLLAKLRSLWYVHFILTILFVLTLASDVAVLYRNDAFSILVLSTKKHYPSFSKIYFEVKALKTFKISTDCRIKTCWSLKRRAILKIPSNVF